MPFGCLTPDLRDAAVLLRFWPLPADASAHGLALDRHLLLNLWIVLALAALAHILLLFGLLFRHRTVALEPAHDSRHKLRLEYLPLLALTLLFAALAIHAERLWAASRYTGADPSALQVEVTGMQLAWYFRYPGPDYTFGRTSPTLVDPGAGNPLGLDPADPHGTDDLTTSELVLPANREVDLTLHALDVIHGFAIPELRLKQNAVPGQTLHIHFTSTTPGAYAILCTQLCGLGHFRMNATLRILPPADFATWLALKSKPAQASSYLPRP
jgi:cytochrome c oxidase subunit 2